VEWDSIINNSEFVHNVQDYIEVLHVISEQIVRNYLVKEIGFGELCAYDEVKKNIQSNLSTIRIVGDDKKATWTISHEQAKKTLTIFVKVGHIKANLAPSLNFEKWGRLIETAMNLRPLRTQVTINIASQQLEAIAKRLSEAIAKKVKVAVDWSFIKHFKFEALLNYIEIIHRVCKTCEEWLPTIAIIRENHTMQDILKESVHTFSLRIDADSTVNESEFIANEYGVDFAKVQYDNPDTREHIVAVVNLSQIESNRATNLGLELKAELLVTPDRAIARLKQKKTEEHRARAEANAEAARDAQLRAQREGNRIQEKMLWEMRR